MLHLQSHTLNLQHRGTQGALPCSLSLQQTRPRACPALPQSTLTTQVHWQQAPGRSLVVVSAKGATASKGFGTRKQKVLKDGCPCGSNLYYKVMVSAIEDVPYMGTSELVPHHHSAPGSIRHSQQLSTEGGSPATSAAGMASPPEVQLRVMDAKQLPICEPFPAKGSNKHFHALHLEAVENFHM